MLRYIELVIQSWGNGDAEEVFKGRAPRGVPQQIIARARRILAALNAATAVGDMATPPGNRLHKLGGGETWAVRVNDQYRVTFVWGANGPEEVWLGDYH
ncbi:MAG: type II toxin-antitoxin system RelE/ParE family toxin [Phenylobacterium sp.]|uniref:type II toxin-antitoxin system RelE/ParE family toxin n=1 Tax=Phenylobacterium sp. TaxID=1871053 RepID=UPI001A1CDD8F|nr:type II toxin-antitoxin system RelE/ParE family toxin [Phenylobacterium sp.]MBJ7411754.1 type II toxin-antitoxin system RelE/ParE family toxin [Phenylobacterium sp.]